MKKLQLKQLIKEEIFKVLNEFEDLSIKNNYLDKNFYDPTTGKYSEDVVVDSDKIFQDLIKTKAYFKSKLPLYQDGKPLTDFQIDSLIDTFSANERDIMASDMDDIDRIKWINKWKSTDIDDLADNFIDFADGISENWEEWEFHDVTKQKYSGEYPSN
jgi:hypothetical protein